MYLVCMQTFQNKSKKVEATFIIYLLSVTYAREQINGYAETVHILGASYVS